VVTLSASVTSARTLIAAIGRAAGTSVRQTPLWAVPPTRSRPSTTTDGATSGRGIKVNDTLVTSTLEVTVTSSIDDAAGVVVFRPVTVITAADAEGPVSRPVSSTNMPTMGRSLPGMNPPGGQASTCENNSHDNRLYTN
jgi:hypothetical protein